MGALVVVVNISREQKGKGVRLWGMGEIGVVVREGAVFPGGAAEQGCGASACPTFGPGAHFLQG